MTRLSIADDDLLSGCTHFTCCSTHAYWSAGGAEPGHQRRALEGGKLQKGIGAASGVQLSRAGLHAGQQDPRFRPSEKKTLQVCVQSGV